MVDSVPSDFKAATHSKKAFVYCNSKINRIFFIVRVKFESDGER